MRIASFRHEGRTTFGVVTGDSVVEIASPDCPNLRSALAASTLGVLSKRLDDSPVLKLSMVELLPPIPAPEKIICVGYNFRSHLLETGTPIPDYPALFVRFPESQVGHGAPIIRPIASEKFDFEGELAVIISRPGRHIKETEAFSHIAGYACFAENSVRDYQRHSTQATAGKNFSRSGAFGPFLTTADEIADPRALRLTTSLNGEIMQDSGLDDFIFSLPFLISYISTFTELAAGDVIATGTPAGVGMSRKPPVWLKNGDILEVDIPSVGLLRNQVRDEV